ncbi:MAG TPA: aminotransferase class I/II-fold pyridoxal phosphate-dependent enzyme [Candidatus Limnocylindrales bacterium]|nr:aminotransferase class I/II-fold pyridoxal phosphate-dependent enzyme [Candidatus Limnocylindrales bacterium]
MAIQERRMDRMVGSVAHVFDWFRGGSWERHHLDPGVADFTFGNPQEMPLTGLVDALQRNAVPQDKDWFAYKFSEAEPRRIVADSLRRRTGIAFEPEDVAMTAGAFGALGVTIRALCDEGDEVIFLSPPWFFYELMILSSGATPVRVRLSAPDFDLDADAVAAAITPHTRAIIVNSPNNPSGRIYRAPELAALGRVLEEASDRNGRPIILLSDESYNRIVFDGLEFRSPALDYGATITIYTYGKTLLAPGQRIGYAALSPTFPDRKATRFRIMVQQVASGWGFPNALLQHAIGDLEALSVDIAALQARRDRMVPALREMGYEVTRPEGTFYLMLRSPDPNDLAFSDRLAELGALVLPGTIVECPGWFRISLTASDEMVERSLPAFGTALTEAR